MAAAKANKKKRRRPRVHRAWRRTTISPHAWLEVVVAALHGGQSKVIAIDAADSVMNAMTERFDEDGVPRSEEWKPFS